MAKTQPLFGAVEWHSLSGRTSKQATKSETPTQFVFVLKEQEETGTDGKRCAEGDGRFMLRLTTNPPFMRERLMSFKPELKTVYLTWFRLLRRLWRKLFHFCVFLSFTIFFRPFLASMVAPDVWLSFLTRKLPSEQKDKTNLTIYGGLVAASFILSIIRAYIFFLVCLRSSERLHDKMVVALLKVPVLFNSWIARMRKSEL